MGVSLFTATIFDNMQKNIPFFKTNLKEYFNPFKKVFVYSDMYFKNYLSQLSLYEEGTDILFYSTNTELKLKLLKDGYNLSTKDNYPFEFPNYAILSKNRNIKCSLNISKDFSYQGFNFNLYSKQNTVIFYKDNSEFISLVFNGNIEILDCYFHNNGYLDLIINNNNQKILIKTHLALDFFNYHNEYTLTTSLDEMEYLYKCNFNFNYDKILESGHNYIIFSKDNRKYKVDLVKRYCFVESGRIYFNPSNEIEYNSLNKTFEKVIVEHNFLYDFIDLMGLNFIKNIKTLDFNSFNYKYIKYKKMRFDNTLNGALNFVNLRTEKDFFINKVFDGLSILGNFNYKYKKGKFNIKISVYGNNSNNEVTGIFYLSKNKKIIRRIPFQTLNRLSYFCNLEFNFTKLAYDKCFYNIEINVNDNYNVVFDYIIDKEEYDKLDVTYIKDYMEVYRKLNKVENNYSFPNKKELVSVNSQDSNLFISNYIISETERDGELDTEINFVNKDNTPSSLWLNLDNRNYYLTKEEKNITKRLNIRLNSEYAFSSSNYKIFSISLKKQK